VINPSLVQTGTANGVPIMTDVSAGLGSAVAVKVLLSSAYTLANPRPVGFPTEPSFTGAASPQYPGQVVAAGTVLATYQAEATALVAAGAGTFA
jgi:hypothetical protein